MNKLFIVSGISGAGRSTVSTVLEEKKFQVVENLPAELLEQFVHLMAHDKSKRYERTAITVNILDVELLLEKLEPYKHLIDTKLILLTATSDVIIARYKLTRHVHPLQTQGYSLEEAISRELDEEIKLRDKADYFLDSSGLSVSDLRGLMFEIISEEKDSQHITIITFTSFGFKHGLPLDADVIFDVRMIPNPYYIEELRPLTGVDEPVISFLNEQEMAHDTYNQVVKYLEFYLESYIKEARGLISIGIGCSGGQHRSVYISERLTEHFAKRGYRALTYHRDKRRSKVS